jgi:hypothetical protein
MQSSLQQLEKLAKQRLAELVEPLDGPIERSRFRYGVLACGYSIDNVPNPPSLKALLRILREVQSRDTGWPMWLILDSPEVASVDGRLECFFSNDEVFADGAHSDYWTAEPTGRGMLLRGYQEDSEFEANAPGGGFAGVAPGTILDVTIPIWRAGELVRHAERLSRRLNDIDVDIYLRMTWDGLKGRQLSTRASPGREIGDGYSSLDDEVTSTVTVRRDAIDNTLPEIVQALVAPLFSAFDFRPDPAIYVQEIDNLLRRARPVAGG